MRKGVVNELERYYMADGWEGSWKEMGCGGEIVEGGVRREKSEDGVGERER